MVFMTARRRCLDEAADPTPAVRITVAMEVSGEERRAIKYAFTQAKYAFTEPTGSRSTVGPLSSDCINPNLGFLIAI